MAHAVELESVTKNFADFRAVDTLSLTVPEGKVYGFIGPNGAGKTTTIRMIMNIIHPDSGRIRVLGSSRTADQRRRIGYLPEERGLYKKMKVREILRFFGTIKGQPRTEAARRAEAWLERMSLDEWGGRKVEALSKGMSQKIQFIATVIHEPDLVILDEPFSGLDPVNTEVLKEIILDLRKNGRTVIFSTHVMEQAEQLCDFIFMINRGRKVLDGPLGEIKAAHRTGTITIRFEGDPSFLNEIDGVASFTLANGHADILPAAAVDPRVILASSLEKGDVTGFDIKEPSLHDIFLRKAGEKEGAQNDAE